MVVILVLLVIVTLVGFWWAGHEVAAANLMLREVLLVGATPRPPSLRRCRVTWWIIPLSPVSRMGRDVGQGGRKKRGARGGNVSEKPRRIVGVYA